MLNKFTLFDPQRFPVEDGVIADDDQKDMLRMFYAYKINPFLRLMLILLYGCSIFPIIPVHL